MSVGLITFENEEKYILLKDILGSEDHHGDMDFKIAGTEKGITAIQLDVKLQGGVPLHMLEEALDVGREGRVEIIQVMESSGLRRARDSVKHHSPKAEIVKYDPERHSQLIGDSGEMIKFIEELFSCKVYTEEVGTAYIYGEKADLVAEARKLVQDIAVTVKEVVNNKYSPIMNGCGDREIL